MAVAYLERLQGDWLPIEMPTVDGGVAYDYCRQHDPSSLQLCSIDGAALTLRTSDFAAYLIKMKIESIPSSLPGWYDPEAPNFTKPKSWKGCRVRISVLVGINPSKELADARIRLQPRYPGAELHLIPVFTKSSSPTQSISIKGSDEDLLRNYFSTISLPSRVTVEQIITYITKFIPSISIFGSNGLRFKSVTAENVLSFEYCQVDLDLEGLTLITGLNKDWNNHS